MKRILSIIAISLLLCFSLFSAKVYLDNLSSGIQIFGYVDHYCTVYVEGLDAVDSGSDIGMPFSIADATIAHNSLDNRVGREIASWSFATNMSTVNLTFNASPLVHEDDTSFKLNYYITFRYEYSTIDIFGNKTTNMGYMNVHSGEPYHTTIFNNSAGTEVPIISMNRDVRLQLDQTYDISDYPDGFYYATVTIEMEGN